MKTILYAAGVESPIGSISLLQNPAREHLADYPRHLILGAALLWRMIPVAMKRLHVVVSLITQDNEYQGANRQRLQKRPRAASEAMSRFFTPTTTAFSRASRS
jgi:hypothetical protein